MSIEDLAHSTRISRRFLEALEADEFGALPSGPFAKGFIRSYCEALHESPEESLALYAAAISANVARRARPAPPRDRRSLAPVIVSLALLVILGAALAAVTLALRAGRGDDPSPPGAAEVGGASGARPAGEARPPLAGSPAQMPPPAAGSAGSQPATSAPAPGSAVATPANPAITAPDLRLPSTRVVAAPYRLVARASDTTWIRVRMEGGRTTEETIPAGEVREWISNRPFELRIGNAGGLSLELNGQRLPPLGARGTVIMHLVVPVEAP